jgi:hypothetical protein
VIYRDSASNINRSDNVPLRHRSGAQAQPELGFWWLAPATVYALSLILIAAVYIGFAVADGRPRVIAVEAGIAAAFVVVAVLPGRRLGRRRHPGCAAHRRRRLPRPVKEEAPQAGRQRIKASA